MKLKQNKKSQAQIITIVLIILIALVAMLIVWNVVRGVVKKSSEQVDTEALMIQLEIKSVQIGAGGGLEIKIHRSPGEGEINSLKFILEDENGQTYIETISENLPDELETKTYSVFSLLDGVKMKKISVIPVVGDRFGIEITKDVDVTILTIAGLVSWWKFEDNLLDSIGNNDGIAYEDTRFVSGRNAIGRAVAFDGRADYINITDSPSLDITGEITLSAWINLDNYSPNTGDFDRWPKVITKPHTSYANPWELYALGFDHYGEYIMFLLSDGSSQQYAGDSNHKLSLKKWYHIVGTYNGSLISLYINGTLTDTTACNWVLGTNNMPVSIGSRYSPGYPESVNSSMNWFNGSIDDVMIFNKSLTAEQITNIYNNQKK